MAPLSHSVPRYCADTGAIPCILFDKRTTRIRLASRLSWADQGRSGDDLGTSAPGRSRTDTGDPFRGPASSLGLRGLGNNTPERLSDSRAAELIQIVSPGGSYLFSLGRRMQSVTISITFDGVCLRSVTEQVVAPGPRLSRPTRQLAGRPHPACQG